jgi:hypothetical protein
VIGYENSSGDWISHRRAKLFPVALAILVVYQIFTANADHVGVWRMFCDWFLGISAA